MTTPTSNSVPYSLFTPALLGSGQYLGSGYKWGGPTLGDPVTLTYSFPSGTAYHNVPYSTENEWSAWVSLTSYERAAVRDALGTVSNYTNLRFLEVSDNASTVGDIRFAGTNTIGAEFGAHAYYPFTDPSAGDVWFNASNFNDDGGAVPRGSYDFLTILHELGHALGLKHSFETSSFPYAPAIPAAKDNYFYSIMSYTASPWSAHGDNYASFFPTTPMYYDLLALEEMYGQRAFHTGNDVYSFSQGHKYWQAIHDTGGTDTIRYIGSLASTIYLTPGSLSKLSDPIEFQRANGSLTSSRATVTIGPDVVIENAVGGSGNDKLVGNAVRNVLTGLGGNDVMNGAAGNDYLRGGLGNDRLIGGPDSDSFLFNTRPDSISNHDTVVDFNPVQDTLLLDNAAFTRLAYTGVISPNYFRLGTRPVDGNDFIVYDRNDGDLFYDSNGSGAGSMVLIATLTNRPVLTVNDLIVI